MALFNQKLKKLTIKAYTSSARSGVPIGVLEAMYNPPSFSQKYEIVYGKNQGFDSSGRPANYSRSKPQSLNLKLVLDGTGVNEAGLASLFNRKTVSDRVKEFVDLTFRMNGQIHEPNYLVVEWGGKEDGGLIFSCRLESLNVTYTSFDRDGSPLRAELDIVLVSDQEVKKRIRKESKSSPELTHSRIVRSGDTLPLLTKEVYGSPNLYLRVAQVNNLDDFRNLIPGQELFFPPLGSSISGNE
jgi:Contractile injection system tube protein